MQLRSTLSRQFMKVHVGSTLASVLLACTMLFAPVVARADALGLANALRTRECPRPLVDELAANRGLDAVAAQVMRGYAIEEALKRADFRAVRTAVVHIKGDVGDASLKRMLIRSHCEALTDARLTTMGVARGKNEIAIVLAAPFAPPAIKDADKIAREVLALVNQARAESRRWGGGPVFWAPPP
jgi:hypothetical protein